MFYDRSYSQIGVYGDYEFMQHAHKHGLIPEDDMHKAELSYIKNQIKVAGFDDVGELIAAYRNLKGLNKPKITKFDMKDVRWDRINIGSSWVPKYVGIQVLHVPTGISVSKNSKSEHANYFDAMEELKEKVSNYYKECG